MSVLKAKLRELFSNTNNRHPAETTSSATLARVIDSFVTSDVRRLILIAGLPRSGTSSCDAFLHQQPSCLVFDEFHPLGDGSLLAHLELIRNYGLGQVDLWADPHGRDWRGFNRDDYRRAALTAFLHTLGAYTRPTKIGEKRGSDVTVLAAKLPLMEHVYPEIKAMLASLGVETKLIYCARDPKAVLLSNWQMPWTVNIEFDAFAQDYVGVFEASLAALDRCPAEDITAWTTHAEDKNKSPQPKLIGTPIETWVPVHSALPSYTDEWPAEHRSRNPVDEEALQRFAASEGIQRYKARFGV